MNATGIDRQILIQAQVINSVIFWVGLGVAIGVIVYCYFLIYYKNKKHDKAVDKLAHSLYNGRLLEVECENKSLTRDLKVCRAKLKLASETEATMYQLLANKRAREGKEC